MKKWMYLISLLGMLLVVACSSQTEGETAVSSANTASERAAPVESKPVDPNRIYPVSDLSLVAHTGRPQFLNSFANW